MLRSRGIKPEVVLYLENPPGSSAIQSLLKKLKLPVRDIIRDSEAEYRRLNLSDPALTDEALIHAIAAAPVLLQRPIVVHNSRAAIGRPPEAVLSIL